MNRLENKTLGRELSKHRVQDKRMGTGNERVHLGSGLALRSNLREAGQMPCYSSALNYFDIIYNCTRVYPGYFQPQRRIWTLYTRRMITEIGNIASDSTDLALFAQEMKYLYDNEFKIRARIQDMMTRPRPVY